MNSDNWTKLESIMLAALERTGEERKSYLDDVCADDPGLRTEVDAMLRAHEESEVLDIERRLVVDHASADDASTEILSGSTIGPYRIDRRIGRGGMGDVYLAHREDPYRQDVALKLVRAAVVSGEASTRFRREQQILAQLVHPNITRLLDGGISNDGRPYLVMQYVDGVPITEYCDARQLPIDERLRLFRIVCDAVQHAHQNLIVHRDLKPSNILVTRAGEVKLLDFGIAKLLDPQTVEETIAETRTEARLMTPEYAAPEQVRGDTITTATDVYALGILLYELLTGRRPYDLRRRAQREIERVICEVEPIRPSTSVTESAETRARGTGASRLRRTLQGDLDNIVMMALRKEPQRRYASSEQLASDIDRYRSGQPVAARKDTLGYRVGKFVSRNRVGVAAASAFLALLVGFAATMAVQAARISRQAVEIGRERDRVQAEAQKSEGLTDFLLGIFESADPNLLDGKEPTARELLDSAVDGIDQELQGQDELRGHVLAKIGWVYRRMGSLDESIRLLQASLEARRSIYGSEHADIAMSMSRLGEAYGDLGNFAMSDSFLVEALEMQRRILGNDHLDVSLSLSNLGVSKYYQGLADEADTLFTESLAIRQRHITGDDERIVSTLSALGVLRMGKNDFDAAETYLQDAVAMADRLGIRRDITATAALNNLGHLYTRQKRYDLARPLFEEVVATRKEVLGDEHPTVVGGLNNLAMLLSNTGDLEEAERVMREAVGIQRKIGGTMVGRALQGLGGILMDREKYPEAEAVLVEALEILSTDLGAENVQVIRTHARLARLYEAWGKPELQSRHAARAKSE